MIGCADDDSVYFPAVEHLAVLRRWLRRRAHCFYSSRPARLVDIAGIPDFGVRQCFEQLRQIHAAPARADQADADPVVGTKRALAGGKRAGCRSNKFSAIHASQPITLRSDERFGTAGVFETVQNCS